MLFHGSPPCLLEKELVSDVFAYFDEVVEFTERQDAAKQLILLVFEFFFEAKSANGHADFHGFIIAQDLIETLFVSGIVL